MAMSDDLSFRLQQALLEHHVRLEPVQAGTAEQKLFDDNSRLSYIRDLLEADDCFDDQALENAQQDQKSYQELVNELTSLISSPSTRSPGKISLFPATGVGTAAFANWSESSSSSRNTPPCYESFSSPRAEFYTLKLQLESLLMRCAKAVVANDSSTVRELVGELRSLTTPTKTWLQQIALQFTDALVARLTGYGAQMHSTMYRQEVTHKQAIICQMNLPSLRATERYANQVILDHCRGANRVHIVDYGILYGCQWPSLIKALSEREEGPPLMMITGVDFPHLLHAGWQTGPRLVEFATAYGVSLEYHAIGSTSWELVQPRHHLENELLIVNCKLRMRNLREEGFPESPRNVFLRNVVGMKPVLFVQCVVSADLTSPFYVHRFGAAWTNFSARTEYIVESMRVIDESKLEHLSKFMAKSVMNVVACEGADRIERLSSYKTWNSLAEKAGLESLPVSEESISMATSAWGGLPGFTFGVDKNWVLLGWKTEVMNAMSAWRPKEEVPVQKKVLPRKKGVRTPKCQPLYLKVENNLCA